MKGAIAAFAAAAFAHLAAVGPPSGSIAFLITGDEEGPAVNGTVKLLRWAYDRGERFDHCIVGEPTSVARVGDTIKVGRRGSLNGSVTARGRQGHVAYPEKADNPIPPLLRVLAALMAPLDAGTADFAASNLEVTSLDVGNTATNVIPAVATAAFNIRFNDAWTADTLVDALRTRAATASLDGDVTLAFQPCNAHAFLTAPSAFTGLVARAVEAHNAVTPTFSTGGGTSDARFIQAYCPTVELGLIGNAMHMIDESVPLADLTSLTAIYRGIIDAYARTR